jgi:tRNA/tmRNA/rRNA uracil-C5-methylase (TrmA/RlmC/RlmD family)
VYVPNKLNFYAATCKLTSLNEIYILLMFVENVDSLNLVKKLLINNLYDYLTTNSKFNNLVLCYQITTSSTKSKADDPIYFPTNTRFFQICESIEDSREKKYKIYISPNSFTQSNYSAMIQVYKILDTLPKTNTLHYYGRGMTPVLIYLNNNYKSLFGYCGCKIAYDDGFKTIEESKISNINLILDKNREIFFENISKEDYTHIIISASRNGFGKLNKVIEICKPFNKCKLIYIACNMKSFLKEIKDLPISYKILGEVDMFPGTAFTETIIEINLLT